MIFNLEKLEQLQEDMNELYTKCSNIISFIDKEYKEQVKLLKNEDEDLHNSFRWKKIDNPFYEEFVFLMGEDSDFYLQSDGVEVVGRTPDYDDGDCEETKFTIPYTWLELDGDDLHTELVIYATQVIADHKSKYYERKAKMKKDASDKLIENLKHLNQDEIKSLLMDAGLIH